jgi:hypothetical protein
MDKSTNDQAEKVPSPPKKPYTAPSFRYESVFEVSALACGKVQSTQSSCAHSRKAS